MLGKRCSAYRWHESNLGSFRELREPAILMLKEKIKQGNCKVESTEAVCWGGSLCSSGEVAVMAIERSK